MMRLLLSASLAAILSAFPALAENRAVVLANGAYRFAPVTPGADRTAGLVATLEDAGFAVIQGRDRNANEIRTLFSRHLTATETPERLVIWLSGHFVQSQSGTWFLGTDARIPDLATVGGMGIALSAVLDMAAEAPGGAVVLLGSDGRRVAVGAGLASGIGPLDIPQGVTVVQGPVVALGEFATEALLDRGTVAAVALDDRPDLIATGFLPRHLPFLPLSDAAVVPSPPDLREREAWARAVAANTVAGYEAYLRAHPAGANAPEARAALNRLRADPAVAGEAAEAALNLGRERRREIQRALTLLGFGTRGIDGIFGPGTRGAIAAWQGQNDIHPTGFLTADQITRLEAQAARRAAELEAEAEARRAQQERQDRAFWQETGAAGDEAGLRAYLRRYPDGLFAEVARERLAVFEAAAREAAAERDRAAWGRAEAANTVAAYRAYLSDFPRGAFAGEAQERIAALTQVERPDPALQQAQAEEAALNLNRFTRNIIEQRLAAGGYRPGAVDGNFDRETRAAIRRFQQARNLPVTGYVNEATIVQLLAEALR
ncbi:MAG: peptidoglycan-binding protein [Gemmobacter sp.]